MNNIPMISQEVLEFLESRFDVPPRPKDSDNELRWKSAQRAVCLDVRAIHEAQREIKSQRSEVPNNSMIDPRSKD